MLAVDYPEDAPRSMVVINTGNETSRGFHTGGALGDAMHPKYVNNCVESLDVPLSGKWETWTLLFRLHDRFPEKGLVRGSSPAPLTPEDGFDVTIAQFSAENIRCRKGAAVGTIRLYEVVDPDKLAQPMNFPPDGSAAPAPVLARGDGRRRDRRQDRAARRRTIRSTGTATRPS